MGGRGLRSSPCQGAWACMSTMKLQEKLHDNFSNHNIIANKSYAHVQHNGVLKTDLDSQMAEMVKRIKAAK